jgi:uncharacterized protein (DUF1499 family)
MWIVLYLVLGAFLLIILAAGLILVTHVEDWSRDLSINHAATSDDAKDSRLRPIESKLGPHELGDVVVSAGKSLPRWELTNETWDGGSGEIRFVRTTGIVGYKDDILVRIDSSGSGSRLSAESRSRIGKGDLGQNPRNLRELLGRVRAAQIQTVD